MEVKTMLCKHCYEKYSERSHKSMLFCCQFNDGKKSDKPTLSELCMFQRFCSDEDRYIPNKQNKCKEYEL